MIDTVLKSVLSPIVSCGPAPYSGTSTTYAAWSYNELPALIADSQPDVVRYLVNITYVLPHWENGSATRRRICKALIAAGFTVPTCINLGDSKSQRWAIETEYKEKY